MATAAVRNLLGGEPMVQRSRPPEIVADAARTIPTRPSRECTGNFYLDEEVLREEGVTDFAPYAVNPHTELCPDRILLSRSDTCVNSSGGCHCLQAPPPSQHLREPHIGAAESWISAARSAIVPSRD